MKATLESAPFKDAMKTIAVLFDAETELLVTASADAGSIAVETGNGGVYFKQTIEANVEEDGDFVIGVQHFLQMRMQSNLEMECDKRNLSFRSGTLKGTLSVSVKKDKIENQRPVNPFDAVIELPTELFKAAVTKVNFGSALPGASAGIRIQASDVLKTSTTDEFRAALFREKLAVSQDEFDVILKPSFVTTLLSRVELAAVRVGARKGIFKLETDTMEVYHPAIQRDIEDIEAWIQNGIDYNARSCLIKAETEELVRAISEAASIAVGVTSYDVHLDTLVKSDKLLFKCKTKQGSAQSSLALAESDTDKHVARLSSRYLLDMLNLVKVGELEIGFWPEFLLIRAFSGKFSAMLPTISV